MTWRTRRVREMAQLSNGLPFPSTSFSPTESLPLVRIRDIAAHEFDTYIPRELVPPDALLRNGDIVVGMDGDFNVQLWDRGEAALNQRVCALRARPEFDGRFLAYSLPAHLEVINDLTYATTVKHLSSWQVEHIIIEAPELTEQRAIADFLDEQTSRIDTLIDKQTQLIATLRERRAASIESLLSGSRGQATRLKRHAYIQTGVTLNGDGATDDPEWPYLRVANVQTGFVDTTVVKTLRVPHDVARQSLLKSGDVLMTEGGDIDKLGRGSLWTGEIDPCLHQNHIFAVRPRSDLNSAFLVYLLDSAASRLYFRLTARKTTNLASTNKWTLGNLPLTLPSMRDQRETVARIDEQTAKIDTLITKTEQHIALAKERRSALITAAVTGQIDVRTAGRIERVSA